MDLLTKRSQFFYFSFVLILTGFCVQKAMADMEIDMGDQNSTTSSSAAPTATPASQPVQTPMAAPSSMSTPVPTATTLAVSTPAAESVKDEPADTPTPAIKMVEGELKSKDIYEAGIKYYQAKDYETAIRYLKKAVTYKDPYTPPYIFAEAYATLGVIYEFYYPEQNHLKFAVIYYKDALKYEPSNHTARKYLKKLSKYLH